MFQINKFVKNQKELKNYEHDLLLKNPLTTHRYKANFK